MSFFSPYPHCESTAWEALKGNKKYNKKRKAIYKSLVSLADKTVNSVSVSLFTPQSFWFLCDHLSESCHDGGEVL